MDLTNLNVDQLKDLLKKIPGEIKRRTEEATSAAREAAIEKLKQIAREHGYSLEELAGTKRPVNHRVLASQLRRNMPTRQILQKPGRVEVVSRYGFRQP